MAVSETTSLGSQLKEGLSWRCIGPFRGGRVVAVAGDPTDSATFYFGACAGGVWKSTDGGTYWRNVSDGFFNTAAVGALQIAASDPNVIYAGTGETEIRGNVSHGDGVYRSTDGGKTWTNLGLEDTRHIAKIRIHPQNPDHVYVAALGHAWGPNEDRGLYRSTDGGKTWDRILFRSDRAGCIDLSMDPHNPRILYAAFWEAQRNPFSLSSGGEGSSLYKSTDGGDTWTEITRNEGLPKGVLGKIGVAVSPARSDRVWALVEAKDGALFRSDDGGDTWERVCDNGDLRRRAWYYTHVFADPQDEDTVWVLNLQCWKSTDAGKTFNAIPTPHGDNHDLWIDPHNSKRLIEGNDGGACVSYNGGLSWSSIYNQPTAQFYHVTTDTNVPYRVYGSQQDNSAVSLPSMSTQGAITYQDIFEPGGGESGYITVRPDDPNIIFAGLIGSGFGNTTRLDRRTGQIRNITPWPNLQSMGDSAATLKYRIQWTFPLTVSPHDPNVLYLGANMLLRSTDQGASWEEISPDLTRNDPSTHGPSGGPITLDNTGAETYGTIFAFVESPHEKGVFWSGSDDGVVQISRDGSATWNDVTPPELKDQWALISIIEVSPHDPATAYVAATRYKHDDTKPYLIKTNDYGATWTQITNGIPDGEFTRVIREDPVQRGLLFAGTETGIYVSFDDGGAWNRLEGKLPVVPVHDFVVKGNNLAVATHGRSFWILDDLGPLRQLAQDNTLSGERLFAPSTYTRFAIYEGYGYPSSTGVAYRGADPLLVSFEMEKRADGTQEEVYLDAGKNPPEGVIVNYYLPQKPEGEVKLTFLDGEGKEIRTFTSKREKKPAPDVETEVLATAEGEEALQEPTSDVETDEQQPFVPTVPGLNRFIWDLRYPEAVKVPGVKSMQFLAMGPKAPPGRYTVRLTVGDNTFEQPFEVVPDPRVTTTEDEFRQQFDFLMQVNGKVSEIHEAVIRIRDLKRQLEVWPDRLKGQDDDAAKKARDIVKSLTGIEAELMTVNEDSPLGERAALNYKVAALTFMAGAADFPPTQQQRGVLDELSGRVEEELNRLRGVEEGDLADLNARIRELNLDAIGAASKESAQPVAV